MEQNQALNVLAQAVRIAQRRGAYNLEEAKAIATAVSVFATQPENIEGIEEVHEESESDVPDTQTNE